MSESRTTSPIEPDQLLRHAERLAAQVPTDPAAAIGWRRSTSASYYAVFHAIALAIARHLAPASEPEDQLRLTRSIAHDRVADVCKWLSERSVPREHVQPIVARLRHNADLVELAGIVDELRKARNQADYDHLTPVNEEECAAHAQNARLAVALVARIRETPEGREFLALVALHAALK